MKALAPDFVSYRWAPSTAEIAAEVGLDPVEIVRFDGNVPAEPSQAARPGAVASARRGGRSGFRGLSPGKETAAIRGYRART